MADETTYASEMNQPSHRPGMEKVVNRADARDASGNRTSDERPTVGAGHADPFAVKGDPAPRTSTPAAAAPAAGTPADSGDFGIGGRARENAIMGATDKAVTG